MKAKQTISPSATNGDEHVKKILKARARELAQPIEAPQTDIEMLQVLEFRLSRECYAVEQKYVREVHPFKELTLLPCTPAFLRGLINVRGQILPVIDIKKFFDLPEAGISDLHMVIIVHDGDVELGILADAIAGVRTIPQNVCQPSLPTLTGIRAQYLKGVTDEQIVILDVPRILGDEKLVIEEDVEK